MSAVIELPRLEGSVERDGSLADFIWFRTGGPAEWLVKPNDVDDLARFLARLDMDMAHRLGQPDHDPRHPAVADDQVGADPDRKHRHRRVELGEEAGEILDVVGLDQPFRRAAGAEPDEVGKRAACFGAAG